MKLFIQEFTGRSPTVCLVSLFAALAFNFFSGVRSLPYPHAAAARAASASEVALNANRHGIRIQPELDKIDIDAYLKNNKAMKLQVTCLIHDGPCDWVGRWLKPRVSSALLGECLMCTEHQKEKLPKIMNFIQDNFPTEFKIGVVKYLSLFGIEVPKDEMSPETEPALPKTVVSTEEESTEKIPELPVS